MDLERTMRQAELAESRQRLSKVELGAEAMLTELRLTADPLMADGFCDMDLDRVVSLAESLKKAWDQARTLRARIDKLSRALGA
jgi:hypothetical protein